MKWFGRAAGAPYERDSPKVPTPTGLPCGRCGETIEEGDDGVVLPLLGAAGLAEIAYHYACHARAILGGADHLRGRCGCCGGKEHPDPIYLTKRQAAQEALDVWTRQRQQPTSEQLRC